MPWLEAVPTYLPAWFVTGVSRLLSLRASPKLLIGTCCTQFLVLIIGLLQQLSRVECTIAVPAGGPVVVECDTCHRRYLSLKVVLLHLAGAAVVACGLLAVHWRDSRLLYIYGTAMLFFSMVIGLTAMLTALEAPVLEVAVSDVSALEDDTCLELAEEMLASARDHTTIASIATVVDSAGAVLAIRSRELFNYEEIASQHAEVSRAQTL